MSEPFDPRDEERTLAALGGMLPRVAPADDLFARIVAATEGDPPAAVTVLHSRRPGITFAAAAATLAAAAAVAITIGLRSGSGLGTPTASAPVAAHEPSARVQGSADLYRPNAANGVLRLRLRDVPAPPRGAHYEVWVLRRGSTQMTAVGSFTPAKPTVTLSLPLPDPGTYAAVDISVQQNDGPPEHSSISLAGASFTPLS
jgi:Anti-sigma-K factor rskA